MSDRYADEVRLLAYLHPLAMVVILVLGVLVVREGIGLRRARLTRRRRDTLRHRRLGRLFVVLVVLGYVSGLASLAGLRDAQIFASTHAGLTSAALAAFLIGGTLGLRLERRVHPVLRTLHLLLGAGGLLVALLAGVAGFAILP